MTAIHPAPPARILHVTDDASATQILTHELEAQGLMLTVVQAADRAALESALHAAPPSAVVLDLPSGLGPAAPLLELLRARAPETPVIFRWGWAGNWSVEDPTAQLGRAVRRAIDAPELAQEPLSVRATLLERLAVFQEAQLRLQDREYWDWSETLRDTTEMAARTLAVERASVWDVDLERQTLTCLDVHVAATGTHERGETLPLPPPYRDALGRSLSIDVSDSETDPRTSGFLQEYLRPKGIAALLDAPIRREGRVVGVFCLEHTGQARSWSVLERCAAASLATHISRAMEVRDRRALEHRLHDADRVALVGRVATLLSHDLNNALTVVLGHTELLQARAAQHPELAPDLASLQQGVKQMSGILRGLMSHARRDQFERRRIDAAAVLRDMLPMLDAILGSSIHRITRLPDGPLVVDVDGNQLRQLVLNLVLNARDAMPDGGTLQISLSSEGPVGDARLVLRVEDDGHGIEFELQQRIFEPFFTTKPAGAGTGLGLASVRSIVEMHQGHIQVTSAPGRGARFTVMLPAQAAAPTAQPA